MIHSRDEKSEVEGNTRLLGAGGHSYTGAEEYTFSNDHDDS